MTYLLSTICNGSLAEEMRTMAAVLLRRLFSSEFMEFYPKVVAKIFSSIFSYARLTYFYNILVELLLFISFLKPFISHALFRDILSQRSV